MSFDRGNIYNSVINKSVTIQFTDGTDVAGVLTQISDPLNLIWLNTNTGPIIIPISSIKFIKL